ncbi:MAG: PSD1 and planctomycete cytochrome C domain-containing protein [Planctomycetota bacterium]
MRTLPMGIFALLLSQGLATINAEEVPTSAATDAFDATHAEKLAAGLKTFREHVRPILVQHCLRCHGGEATEAELDLRNRDSVLRGGTQGPAIVKGDTRASLLYSLVTHSQEPKMPMDANRLDDAAIRHLADWIDNGAPYDGPLIPDGSSPESWTKRKVSDEARNFWSFQPLAKPEVPHTNSAPWSRSAVDSFIQQKLFEQNLSPQPETDKRTLLRRVTLDLTGLPPTLEEQAAFLADESAESFARVVDRLLSSPRYGERWARHWLDIARWGESHGFEHDYDRPTAYHYRDFVIQAFNEDMPFDRFVRLQIAGDEFEPDNPLAWMATGYLAAGVHSTQITKNEVEKHRYDEMDDMLATVGTSMLGLTIGCARCHDHKYDPIPQADYYRLLSAFTTTVRSEREFDLQPEKYLAAKKKFDAEHAPLQAAVERYTQEKIPERFRQWEANRPPQDPVAWRYLELEQMTSEAGATFTPQKDGSVLVTGKNGKFDTYTLIATARSSNITALRLEALADPSMVKSGPGRAENGNFALTDVKVTVASSKEGKSTPWKIASASATFEQKGLPVAATIDGTDTSGWAVDPEFGKDHAAIFRFETPVGLAEGSILAVSLVFKGNTGHNIGRFRLSITSSQELPDIRRPACRIRCSPPWINLPNDALPEEIQKLHQWYCTIDPEWRKLNERVQEHAKGEPKPNLTKVLVSGEGLPPLRLHSQGQDFFEQTFFLRRGEIHHKEGVAELGLQVLMPKDGSLRHRMTSPPSGSSSSFRRASLANWLTDTETGAGNLLARVIVNRLWQHHFGKGIVATPSDFGTRGAPPTHPELLDWLAGELIRNGWRLKPIHKLLVTSAVYAQRSRANEAAINADPENHLYSRWQSRRLEAEAIRDSLLFVSGTLDPTLFGPGTLDMASPRRSIYLTVKRSQLIPMMLAFDAPDALTGIADRATTTVAPQALLLLNNPKVRELARRFAARVAPEDSMSTEEAVNRAYRMALGRPPRSAELSAALQFVDFQTAAYADEKRDKPRDDALTDFCQTLFCLNEFVYID